MRPKIEDIMAEEEEQRQKIVEIMGIMGEDTHRAWQIINKVINRLEAKTFIRRNKQIEAGENLVTLKLEESNRDHISKRLENEGNNILNIISKKLNIKPNIIVITSKGIRVYWFKNYSWEI